MKPKKKTTVSMKKNVKKAMPRADLFLVDKTLITTKERTHNTV
jgi:hypothetical protein